MSSRQPITTTDGVPMCSYEACEQYDGKRCREMGLRPDGICEPAVIDMAVGLRNMTEIAVSRMSPATYNSLVLERDELLEQVRVLKNQLALTEGVSNNLLERLVDVEILKAALNEACDIAVRWLDPCVGDGHVDHERVRCLREVSTLSPPKVPS